MGSLISSIAGFLLVSLAGGWVLGTGKPTVVAVFWINLFLSCETIGGKGVAGGEALT